VLNLDECVAVTQNYIAPSNLHRALHFFKSKPDQVSGLREHARKSTLREELLEVLPQPLKDQVEAWEAERSKSWRELTVAAGGAPFAFGFRVNLA
jgi:hypothetical protein